MASDPFIGPGVTALGLAAARSVESGRPDRLIDDPHARRLFQAAGARLAMRTDWPRDGEDVTDAERLHLHGSRYIGLRTRVYDDVLEAAVARGVHQAVLLGAGLDTRAQRLCLHPELALYEIDAPGVLAFKRDALAPGGITARCRLTQIGADLSGEWQAPLRAAGFRPDAPTVWLAEGVLPYLTSERQADLIETVARTSAPGSSLTFDAISGGDIAELSKRSGIDMRSMLQGTGGAGGLVDLLERRGWTASCTDATAEAERYGRDLSDPFADDGAGDHAPPWLETVFVEASTS